MARQPDNKSADNSAANLKSDDSALIRELALLLDETSLTEIEIERERLSIDVAVAGGVDRTLGLIAQRGAA